MFFYLLHSRLQLSNFSFTIIQHISTKTTLFQHLKHRQVQKRFHLLNNYFVELQ